MGWLAVLVGSALGSVVRSVAEGSAAEGSEVAERARPEARLAPPEEERVLAPRLQHYSVL